MPNFKRKNDEFYTYQEYSNLNDDTRLEIIDGVIYDMAASPVVKHQTIAGHFFTTIVEHLKDKKCRPFIAPLDVVLDDINVVQPDVFVVCDPEKITEKNIKGTPDLIIEILSPYNIMKDRRQKKWLYERHGVKEYIIVSPMEESAERYWLDNGKYGIPDLFAWDESFTSNLFPDLNFNLRIIFEKGDAVGESGAIWEPTRVSPDEELKNR